MMRHSVIFAAQVVEPDPAGTWVRHEEAAELEATLKGVRDELSALHRERKGEARDFEQAISEKEARIARQERVIKAAKERLELHGHTANCASRQGKVSAEGHESHHRCNCGLDQWMKESGVG